MAKTIIDQQVENVKSMKPVHDRQNKGFKSKNRSLSWNGATVNKTERQIW